MPDIRGVANWLTFSGIISSISSKETVMRSVQLCPEIKKMLSNSTWRLILEAAKEEIGTMSYIIFKDFSEYGVFRAAISLGFDYPINLVDLTVFGRFNRNSFPWGSWSTETKAIQAIDSLPQLTLILILEEQLKGHRRACSHIPPAYKHEFRFK